MSTAPYVTHRELAEALERIDGRFVEVLAGQKALDDKFKAVDGKIEALGTALDDKIEARYMGLYNLINDYLLSDDQRASAREERGG